MKKTDHLLIVILNHKTYPQLKKCMEYINRSVVPSKLKVNILILDSEFKEGELAKLKKKFPKAIFIKEAKNLGAAGGFYKGFKECLKLNPEYIMMVTPSILISNDTIVKLVHGIESDRYIGIAGAKVLHKNDPKKIFFAGGKLDKYAKSSIHLGLNEIDRNQFKSSIDIDFLNCPLLIKREVFEKVGNLNPSFFLYYEDIDWHTRIKKAGYKLLFVSDAIAWNDKSSSARYTSITATAIKEYYLMRNLLRFIKMHFSLREIIIAYLYRIKELISIIITMKMKKDNGSYYKLLGMWDFLRGRFGERKFKDL